MWKTYFKKKKDFIQLPESVRKKTNRFNHVKT